MGARPTYNVMPATASRSAPGSKRKANNFSDVGSPRRRSNTGGSEAGACPPGLVTPQVAGWVRAGRLFERGPGAKLRCPSLSLRQNHLPAVPALRSCDHRRSERSTGSWLSGTFSGSQPGYGPAPPSSCLGPPSRILASASRGQRLELARRLPDASPQETGRRCRRFHVEGGNLT
jgi:hypothetical protein